MSRHSVFPCQRSVIHATTFTFLTQISDNDMRMYMRDDDNNTEDWTLLGRFSRPVEGTALPAHDGVLHVRAEQNDAVRL